MFKIVAALLLITLYIGGFIAYCLATIHFTNEEGSNNVS